MDKRSAKEIWEATKGALQIQVNKANYHTWLKDTTGVSYQGNQFIIGTPSAFAKEWLEKRLHSLVKKTLISVTGQDTEVQFQVCSKEEARPKMSGSPKPRLSTTLNPRYTFDTFVVGWCNRLAYAAAIEVAEEPGHHHNPLCIYGGCGLGKTHLAQAIGNAAAENDFEVIYISAEQFTNEFINAIKEKKTEQFRTKFRNADLFLIEDIQFITGKPQTQQGLLHTFNELHNADRQVVITSDRPLGLIPLAESRLRSSFESGLITPIQPPDFETRLAILQAKAERQQVSIDGAILQLIAQRCQENVGELEGSLHRLSAYANLTGKQLSLEQAKQALQDMTGKSVLTPDCILNAVASYFQISPETLKGRQRDHQTALARQVAMYLLREKTHRPLQEVGKILGGRDRSTVLQSHHKISTMLNNDQTLQNTVQQIMAKLAT